MLLEGQLVAYFLYLCFIAYMFTQRVLVKYSNMSFNCTVEATKKY